MTTRPAFIRRIDFVDRANATTDHTPIHVPLDVYVDGEKVPPQQVNLRLGFSITGSRTDGTVVRFHVHPDVVDIGRIDPDSGAISLNPKLWGKPVLTPQGQHWSTVHVRDRHGEETWDGAAPSFEDAFNAEWVEVVVFVAEAGILQAPVTADAEPASVSSPTTTGPSQT